MSHFVVLALVPKGTRNAEDFINTVMEPFSEEIEVPEYETECWCVGEEARNHARLETENKFPIDKLREIHQGAVEACCKKYGLDHTKYDHWMNPDERVEADTDVLWKMSLEPRNKFEAECEKNHPAYGKPNPKCDECNGTGKRKTTYNPDAHWDWFEIGGRWDNYLPNKKNKMSAQDLLDTPKKDWIPYAVITPDGKWCQHGKMGWFGMSLDEKSSKDWGTEVLEVLKAHKDCMAHVVDCHI